MGILVDPIKCSPSHPSEEILEEYVFHRLPESLADQVEEHLLLCETCQDALAETDEFVAALKAEAKPPTPESSFLATLANRRSLAPLAALVILALVVVRIPPRETSAPVAVTLSSLRGLNPLAPAPAGKPLQLQMEAPDLATGQPYRVEVVNATGKPIWQGTVAETNRELLATMPTPLSNGVYWVRLYGPGAQLLREFGLSAR